MVEKWGENGGSFGEKVGIGFAPGLRYVGTYTRGEYTNGRSTYGPCTLAV